MRSVFRFMMILIFVFTASGVWPWISLDRPSPNSPTSEVFEIKKGESFYSVTTRLTTQQWIHDPFMFRMVARITGASSSIRSGEFELTSGMSPIEILKRLTSNKFYLRTFTIPEGFNTYQIAEVIESQQIASRQEVLRVLQDPQWIHSHPQLAEIRANSVEGFLFPDTYSYSRGMSAETILERMRTRFFEHWDAEFSKVPLPLNLTFFETITLASIVEKETGAAHERPLIASVFLNRLKKGMRLQSDPTTIYGIWNRYDGNLRKSDLQEATPYNTYAVSGLPVGPIANPGREAIQAVLKPATSNYLYFVSKNDGAHQFSETLEDHNRAVRAFQMNSAAREGRSWRDLTSNPLQNRTQDHEAHSPGSDKKQKKSLKK